MPQSTEEADCSEILSLTPRNAACFASRTESLLESISGFDLAAPRCQENPLNSTLKAKPLGESEALALRGRGRQMEVSIAEPGINLMVLPQPQISALNPSLNPQVVNNCTVGKSQEKVLACELDFTETHSLVKRSLSLLKCVSHPTSATAMCEGSCAVRLFPLTGSEGFNRFDLGNSAMLKTLVRFLPPTLTTHKTKAGFIQIEEMDTFPKGSISRGSLSKIFKRVGSDPNQSPAGFGSNRAKPLRSLFQDSSITRKQSFQKNSPTIPSPTSPSSSHSPDVITTPAIPDIPEPMVSVWESDTEDEEQRNSIRAKIRTHIGRFKRNRVLPNLSAELQREPELEKEPEVQVPREPKQPRELRVVSGTRIPSRVFGRNIPYEITGQLETAPTGTFGHFPKLPRNYSPPASNEILHIREQGYEYLTLERLNGVTSITAGTLQCLSAELAYPLFAKHDSAQLFVNLIFCGSMLVGNENLLDILFRQLKNCVGKPEQQLNIIHFITHWMKEKPEDFSWREEILELRHQVFRYLLAVFRQTELATNLWRFCLKHEKLEYSYEKFVANQKQGWFSFSDIAKIYGRLTDCDLVDGGLSGIDAGDLTHYIAVVDLVLFRDGSEMSTLDQYWKENDRKEVLSQYANQHSTTGQLPANRVNRILARTEMIKHWVSLEILQLSTCEARVQMVRVFVTVADNLLEMGDLHGAYCIVQGLESPLVHHLRRSWEEMGVRCLRQYKKLRRFLYERAVYDTYLNAPSQEPVIPYFGYFLDEVTVLRNEKDHSSRVKSTGTTRLHKDVSLKEFGTWDTFENKPHRPVSGDGISQLSTSVDLKKYRNLLAIVKGHRERANPNYWFAGEIDRESFILRLHIIGMNSFATLGDLENSAASDRKGRLNFMSRLVETRILEAWSLIPNFYIPECFCDGETMRAVVLQKLHLATRE